MSGQGEGGSQATARSDGSSSVSAAGGSESVRIRKRGARRRRPPAPAKRTHKIDPWIAARTGNVDAIKAYMDEGGHVDRARWSGFTPLHRAAEEGIVESIECLLAYGADVNCRTIYGGFSPLHLAARALHMDACRALLEGGADIKQRCGRRKTPTQHLILIGQEEFARELERASREVQQALQVRLIRSAEAHAQHDREFAAHLKEAEIAMKQSGADSTKGRRRRRKVRRSIDMADAVQHIADAGSARSNMSSTSPTPKSGSEGNMQSPLSPPGSADARAMSPLESAATETETRLLAQDLANLSA